MTLKNNLNLYAVFLIQSIFIACGLLYNSLFYVISLLFSVLYVLLSSNINAFALIIFTMPFAYIMKFNQDSISFFTIIVSLSLVILIIKNKISFSIYIIFSYILLLCICVLADRNISLDFFKIIINTFLVFIFIKLFDNKSYKKYILSFIFGILISCLFAYLFKDNELYLSYFNGYDYVWLNGQPIWRFPGMFGDPNYLSIALIMSLCSLYKILSDKNTKRKILYYLLFILITIIGIFTFSKSFYFMFLIVLFCNLIFSKGVKQKLLFIFVICFLLLILYINPSNIFDAFFVRFDTQELLTGRNYIWDSYIDAINEDGFVLLFGHGLSSEYIYLKAAHNMYLQTTYLIGVLGLIIFMSLILYIFFFTKKHSVVGKRLFNLVVLFVMYFFLNGLTAFDLPFYLMICYICCVDYNSFLERDTCEEIN